MAISRYDANFDVANKYLGSDDLFKKVWNCLKISMKMKNNKKLILFIIKSEFITIGIFFNNFFKKGK